MKKCKICGSNISRAAGKCPHCGDPSLSRKLLFGGLAVLVLIPGLFILVVIIMAFII